MNQMETRVGELAGIKRLRAKVEVPGRLYDRVSSRTNERRRTPRDTVRWSRWLGGGWRPRECNAELENDWNGRASA
jgi:hypothetical protein